MARKLHFDSDPVLDRLLAQSEAICNRSESVLDWARHGRRSAPPAPIEAPPAPVPRPVAVVTRPRRASRPVNPPRTAPAEVRHEAELAPSVAQFLEDQGLTVARELCLYPTRRSRRRTVADLAGLIPDPDAIRERMRLEGRRVTVAEFWPALLQTLSLVPAGPFRRQDLLGRLGADPLTRSITAERLSRYLRTLRRYGYLRRVSATTYVKRGDYLPVARPGSLVAVELKRRSFRAALDQARSYARVVDTVWVATAGAWQPGGEVAQDFARWGIGALEVRGDSVHQRLAPAPGKGREAACSSYRRILEERLVRERVLGRPRAFA